VELERELADLHAKQAALVFTSGYVADQSSISTIAKPIPNRLILSDELNHNSMIEGINQSNCAKQIFRHNDLDHLKQLLTSAGESRSKIGLSRVFTSWMATSLPLARSANLPDAIMR
jgi:5-aminolevulinate synthase